VDVAGGSRILVSESTQEVKNIGGTPTVIQAAAKDAGIRVDGGKAGATLEITDEGNVVLANELYNVVVKLGLAVPKILTGTSQYLQVDARVGGSRIDVQGQKQIVYTGIGNTIIDRSGGAITMEGTLKQFDKNTITNFGIGDLIHIKGVVPDAWVLKSAANGAGSVLSLRAGSESVEMLFGGHFGASAFSVSSDFAGGSFVKLA
jgi:hypothetical protein